jgi:hemerythrin superfamily protein
MSRLTKRLLAGLRRGGRTPVTDVSQGAAERGSSTLGSTGGPQPTDISSGRLPRGGTAPSLPTPDDVIDVIAPQHAHVKTLLESVWQSTGQHRTAAFHTLRLTLALHETAEEQAIHPQALRQLGPYDRAANDRIAEEQTAGQTISALELVDVDSDQFNFTFGHFATSVTDHAAAEEADEWPALRHITDPAVINAMVGQMQAVPRLAEDRSAPGIQATFSEMQDWAKVRLPAPPGS